MPVSVGQFCAHLLVRNISYLHTLFNEIVVLVFDSVLEGK